MAKASWRRPLLFLVVVVGLLLLPQIAQAFGNVTAISLASRILIYGLAAVSLDLILGYGGMASFGHAAFFGLGGYVVAILYFHATEGSALLGIIPGTEQALPAWAAAIVVAGIAGLLLCRRLMSSPFGVIIRGCRQNERRLIALGISTYRYKLACFVLAAAIAGLAGALAANHARFVSPDLLHWTKSGELMIMVILGGPGTLIGPVLGAAALICLETALASMTEHWMFVLGPILVLVILFARRGIWGAFASESEAER